MQIRTHGWSSWDPVSGKHTSHCRHAAGELTLPERQGLKNSRLQAVEVVRMYLTLRNRTAWNGTTSLQYKGKAALEASLDHAKHTAEDWRAMGSSFQIREEPALAFDFGTAAVVFAETHATDPFRGWGTRQGANAAAHLRPGVGLAELLDIMRLGWPIGGHPDENSQKIVVVRDPRQTDDPLSLLQPLRPRATLKKHVSVAPSGGSGYFMGWRATHWQRQATSAGTVAALFAAHSDPGYTPDVPLVASRPVTLGAGSGPTHPRSSPVSTQRICSRCFLVRTPSGVCGCD